MRILTFLLLLITGLGMAVPGLYLAWLGGSLYYAVTGLLILVSALLVLRRNPFGVTLVWLILFGTIAWSLWEVGFDGWALMPRLIFLTVAALWVALALPRRDANPFPSRRMAAGLIVAGIAVALAWGIALPALRAKPVAALPVPAASGPNQGEWLTFGNSPHGTRYSQLAQITPANAKDIEQAWVYRSGMPAARGRGGRGILEVTPLMVDGTLYGCTGQASIFALDPVTGKQIWRHETKIKGAGGRAVCRGVSYFRAPEGTAECATRLLVGTVDNRLIAVDAKTGATCRSFGTNGEVNLLEGIGKFPRGWTNPTSPPTIVHGTAVIGSYIIDGQSTHVPPGVIRGYDAVTGAFKWAFDPGRPDEHGPLAPGQTYTASTPNSWTVFSGDEQLGMVYVPMGMGSPDFYGRNRTPQTDRFSTALVALDADTGAVRWTFQAVHHDLWDYDLAAQPVLVDFPAAGGKVPGLVQATKTGQVFVLDRRTGKPLLPVQERPVPVSDIEKERTAPTQPFSTAMPDFAGPTLTEADMWGMTPFDQLYCRIQFRQAKYQGIYTPMHLGLSIRTPGELGGIDWGSVSVDEGRGILIVNSNIMADYDELITREQANKEYLFPRGSKEAASAPPHPQVGGAAMAGTPYGTHWKGWRTGLGIPCQRPPYGYLSAVELKTGKLLWQHPIGNASNSGPWGVPLGLPLPLGVPNIGGTLVTRGGVIFIGATQDQYFRAVDEATGKTLWQTRLPAGGHANPMTYMGKDGKQYVVLNAAGNGSFGTGQGDYFIAWRLKS